MIAGAVTVDRVPMVRLPIAGREWAAIVDSGFNDDLELPEALRDFVNPKFEVEVISQLAGNQQIREDGYRVDFPFDGRTMPALATFVEGEEILLGTGLLADYRLEIDFTARTVHIQRVASQPLSPTNNGAAS
jgi:hypothetical protein